MAYGNRPYGGYGAESSIPTGDVLTAQVNYTTEGEGSVGAGRIHLGEIDYTTVGSGALTLQNIIGARIEYAIISNGSITIPPIEGPFRVELVGADATPLASIENAAVSSVTSRLNSWETWSFSLPLDDPKAHFLLEERIREAQIWKGDILLSWGPMNRPQVANGLITVQGTGAAWHLSRRHVGKANRDNLLCNPSFEQGLKCWNFLRGAYFLDYQHLEPNQTRIFGPGREGPRSNALEINMDLRPPVYPSGSTGGGTIGTHVVVSGNTLWGLATTYYGSGTKWPIIYEANAAQIKADAISAGLWNPKDPGHWIFPGQVLTIPGLKTHEAPPPPDDNNERWGDTFAYQEFTISGGARGATLTLTGFVKIPSQYLIGWGQRPNGLLLQRFPTNYKTNNFWTQNGLPNTWGGRRAYYTDIIETSSSRMSEGHPLDGWIRHEASITVPPGKTEIVHARLCAVQGKTYWDKITLTQDTAFERFDTDQALIVKGLVEHAQDTAFDKNNVNITTDTPTTGVKRDLVALHSEHANIWNLITEQTGFEQGLDLGMRYTPTKRILTTHYPFRGRTRTSLHLRLGRNIASYDWVFDGEAAASSTIVLGSGTGSDREEAVKIIPDAFADGLILETVTALGPEIPVDRLQEIANELGAINKNPEILTITTYPHDIEKPERRFIGYLNVGDLVPVTIFDGPIYDSSDQLTGWHFTVNDLYRLVEMTMNPDETLNLLLNRRDFGNA